MKIYLISALAVAALAAGTWFSVTLAPICTEDSPKGPRIGGVIMISGCP